MGENDEWLSPTNPIGSIGRIASSVPERRKDDLALKFTVVPADKHGLNLPECGDPRGLDIAAYFFHAIVDSSRHSSHHGVAGKKNVTFVGSITSVRDPGSANHRPCRDLNGARQICDAVGTGKTSVS